MPGCEEHHGVHHCNYECKGGYTKCQTYAQAVSQNILALSQSDPSKAQTLIAQLRNSTSPICYKAIDTSCDKNDCPLKGLCAKTSLNASRATGSTRSVIRQRFVVK